MHKRKLLNPVNMLVFAGILIVPNTIRTLVPDAINEKEGIFTRAAKGIKNVLGGVTFCAGKALIISSSLLTGYTLLRKECFFRGDLWQGLKIWFDNRNEASLSTVIQHSYPGQLFALAAIGIVSGVILAKIGTALQSRGYPKNIVNLEADSF
jgi:hypothetical protein